MLASTAGTHEINLEDNSRNNALSTKRAGMKIKEESLFGLLSVIPIF